MSDAMSRDDLVIAVNRLMICAMEDVDCGRDEAGPTTLDLVERIERHDRALRAENERLREVVALIGPSCESFNHAMRDRHKSGEPCPIVARYADLIGGAE